MSGQNHIIRFGSPDCTDVHGWFFTPSTDYGTTGNLPVLFDHGACPVLKGRKLGEAYLKADNAGLSVGFDLYVRDDYEKYIVSMLASGALSWSGGSEDYKLKPVAGAYQVERFVMDEASLTPTPAEPWFDVNPKVQRTKGSGAVKQIHTPKEPLRWYAHQVERRQKYFQYLRSK